MPHRLPLSRLKKLFHSSPGRREPILSRASRTRKPFLELLEDRWVPSAYTVSNTLYSGTGSLDAAIASAITSNDTAAMITFSVPANSTIQLDSSDVNTAAAKYGPTAFFIGGGSGTTNITIDGSGAPGLVIDGGSAVRLFTMASGDSLTLENLKLAHGNAPGGGGAVGGVGGQGGSSGGGGGGAGLGGAVFVDDGAMFQASDCTFTKNTAQGGFGGAGGSGTGQGFSYGGGGGGGRLGGGGGAGGGLGAHGGGGGGGFGGGGGGGGSGVTSYGGGC